MPITYTAYRISHHPSDGAQLMEEQTFTRLTARDKWICDINDQWDDASQEPGAYYETGHIGEIKESNAT